MSPAHTIPSTRGGASTRPGPGGRADSNPMIVAALSVLATLSSLYDLLLLGLGTH